MPIHESTALRVPATSTIFGQDHSAAALAYAALGFPVFPIHQVTSAGGCSCGTRECRDTGKHPRIPNGLLGATCDPDRVASWWQRWPEANIGVRTGSISHLWVLDIDPNYHGLEGVDELEDAYGPMSPTWCVETGGDGLHLWFQLDKVAIRNSVSKVGPGLDVRGEGGYVIVPPSSHRSGQAYRWPEGWHPSAIDLAPAPSWLERLALQASQKMIPPDRPPLGKPVGGNHFDVASTEIAQGSRNEALTRVAGAMRRHGAGEEAIETALRIENAARCKPPLDEDEVTAIARSVMRYTPDNSPRIVRPGQRGKGFVQFVAGKAVAG